MSGEDEKEALWFQKDGGEIKAELESEMTETAVLAFREMKSQFTELRTNEIRRK